MKERFNDRPSCDALGLERPDKYCRMQECEVAENGGQPCECWKRDRNESQQESGIER